MAELAISRLIAFVALTVTVTAASAASDVGAADGRLLGEVGDSKNRVYWACRVGACRINIRFANPDLLPRNATGIIVSPPTQVWLLKADGSHIPTLREVPTNIGATNFEFPLSAQDDALAVVVRIDDKLHTWWLAATAK